MTKTLIFVSSHRRHVRVADRLIAALAARRKVKLFSFDRGRVDHPVYLDTNISHTSLGRIPNGIAVLRLFALARAIWILARAKRRIEDADTVLLVNTLELLVISWLCGLTRFPTVYDVADIHPVQISKSYLGRSVRWLEQSILKRVNLLVVSSPWFYWEYFGRRLGVSKPALLIENRVGPGVADGKPHRVPSNRIAWNGLLRCKTSADVLLQCLTASPRSLHLSLHGSLERLPEIGPKLLEQANCSYTGQYDQESLGSLLATSSFVWAVDFTDGDNSKWLLPNRLYEALAVGIPVIAVDRTATGEVVRHYNIGIVLPECSPQAVIAALEHCSPEVYELWLTNIRGLKSRAVRGNEWKLVFDDVRRWGELQRLPSETHVGVVLRADAPSSAAVNRT
jgi:succinoglycan biosynthesis protein ExoL